jgi:hypothetical protein
MGLMFRGVVGKFEKCQVHCFYLQASFAFRSLGSFTYEEKIVMIVIPNGWDWPR